MAISRISVVDAAGTSLTPGTHDTGDLLLMFAYRQNSVAQPTIPVGWTPITNVVGANTNSINAAYKIAASSSETSGTWTNAHELMLHVYRGQSTVSPIGAFTNSQGTGTTVTYGLVNMINPDGTSWVAAGAGHRNTNTAMETPPTNMTNLTNEVGTGESASHDTNTGVASWPSTNVAVGGSASGWCTIVVEILDDVTLESKNIYNATDSWVAPTGVTKATIQVWGGGGAGGGSTIATTEGMGGGGGGGFSYDQAMTVVPADSYTVTIGAGGTGGSGIGPDGSDSWFSTTGTVLAKGGIGGKIASGSWAGGAGGASASGVGDVKTSGGAGGKGSVSASDTFGSGGSGSGGGDKSTGGAGGAGALATAGAAGTTAFDQGGLGVIGKYNAAANVNGSNGTAPGAGGSGAYRFGAGTATGGSGAAGRVVVYGITTGVVATPSSATLLMMGV